MKQTRSQATYKLFLVISSYLFMLILDTFLYSYFYIHIVLSKNVILFHFHSNLYCRQKTAQQCLEIIIMNTYLGYYNGFIKKHFLMANLFKQLRTYFSKEIFQQINAKIDYFVFIILLNFLFTLNLFVDFFKFFKCRLFNNNYRKSSKIFVNNEEPE